MQALGATPIWLKLRVGDGGRGVGIGDGAVGVVRDGAPVTGGTCAPPVGGEPGIGLTSTFEVAGAGVIELSNFPPGVWQPLQSMPVWCPFGRVTTLTPYQDIPVSWQLMQVIAATGV